MKLFIWSSIYLSGWTDDEFPTGHIIVVANNVEEARDKARKTFIKHAEKCNPWDEDMKTREKYIEDDLAKEPNKSLIGSFMDHDVIFINGPE